MPGGCLGPFERRCLPKQIRKSGVGGTMAKIVWVVLVSCHMHGQYNVLRVRDLGSGIQGLGEGLLRG